MLNNIEQLSKLINKEIEQLDLGHTPSTLYDPLYYILSLGGKRIRPLLTLMSYSLYKDDPKEAILPSLAVEVFHNFTLMHDDIMDNAPLRRGNTTVHEKWNENVAILSGDVMLIKAYELLMHVPTSKLPQASRHCDNFQVEQLWSSANRCGSVPKSRRYFGKLCV